jgi:T-complex protein 1 subunit alpha
MEPSVSKIKSIKAATEAAIALLRIDDLITIDKKEQQDDGHGH